MKKKLLSILLSIGLVLTMIPASVFADGPEPELISEINATIEFDMESGTATITSPDSPNYSATLQLIYAYKNGVDNPTYGFVEGQWWSVAAEAPIEGTPPSDGFDYYQYYVSLNCSDPYSYLFDSGLSTITINGNTLTRCDEPEGTDYTTFGFGSQSTIAFFAKENNPSSAPASTQTSSYLAEAAEDVTEDVTVDYTYLPESNTAEKVFNVTIDYTFPATLDAKGNQNTYTWDAENGKYTQDTLAEEDKESYTLSNEGAFEIKLTNQSNVDIEYEVSYDPNTDAVFVSAVDGSMTNATGTIETVAQGQKVTSTGINITDDTAATTAKSGDFNSAICTGTLEVTGTYSTPLSSGTDKLGTFTINIAEHETTATSKTIEEILGLAKDEFPEDPTEKLWWNDNEYFASVSINQSGLLEFKTNKDKNNVSEIIELTKEAEAVDYYYVYTCENGAKIRFEIEEGKLSYIEITNEPTENDGLEGSYYPYKLLLADFIIDTDLPTSYDEAWVNDENDFRCYYDTIKETLVVGNNAEIIKNIEVGDISLYWNKERTGYMGFGKTIENDDITIVVGSDDKTITGDFSYSIAIMFGEGEFQFMSGVYVLSNPS